MTTEATIYERFHEAYGEMLNPKKNATNPAFKSKYANLEELLNVTRPILVAAGFTLIQEPVSDNGSVGVRTRLIHTSGEVIDFGSYTVPLAKHDAQGAGSAITYCRRYAIAAIFGLAQEDDDGNEAAKQPEPVNDPLADDYKAMWALCAGDKAREARVIAALGNPKGHQAAMVKYAALSKVKRTALNGVADGTVESID